MSLPLIQLGAAPAVLDRARRRVGKYRDGYLRTWRISSQPDRPALIFAPGFLSETCPDTGKELVDWQEPIVRLAMQQDMSAYLLHWPSSKVLDLITGGPVGTVSLAMNGLSARGAGTVLATLGTIMFLGPALLALASQLGVSSPLLLGAIRGWRKAVSNADRVGSMLHEKLQAIDRPLVLVGHSLGGRLVLRAAESSSPEALGAVVALAPAVAPESLDLRAVARGSKTPPEVYYSDGDMVLSILFRLGQLTGSYALGYAGAPPGGRVTSTDASAQLGRSIGHLDYSAELERLIEQRVKSL